jgi:NADPH:quinone reductase-like Zn-dependent oxidoreductase
VQLGKVLGAEVTALAGPTNQLFVTSLGADRVLDYTRTPKPEGPFDVIFDTVAQQGFHYWKKQLTANGIYVSVLPKLETLITARFPFLSGQRTVKIVGVKPSASDLGYLQNLTLRNRLKLEVDRIIPLKKISEALDKSRTGRTRGKIIIEIRS